VAESRFLKLDPSHGLDRVGGRLDRGPDRTVADRNDPVIHHHLEPVVIPPSEPAPPAPTGEVLRDRLRAAIDAQAAADAVVASAEAACQRAADHREACNVRLASFADLDADFADAVTEALRSDGRPGGDVADLFRERIAARTVAETEARAAGAACARLLDERTAAEAAAMQARRAVERATCAVLGPVAEEIAARFHAAMREAERCARALAAFDRYVGPRDGALPGMVRGVLTAEPLDMRVPISGLSSVLPEPWRKAGERLKADPAASVEMDYLLPTLPSRPPPTLAIMHGVTRMVPLKPEGFLPVPTDPEAAPPAAEEPASVSVG
jgi:hypothetical protein